ncbi:hypothetical protein ACIRP2_37100 [Streptomyces sp. NPDC101194]|uniref:hypothetical protein n=1 Tax=Streptomyces sp. NPDC101194 TaxID=3366127 RepID=UPI003816FCE6
MSSSKDWGLVMRTIVGLIGYRISRILDVILIALVPLKLALTRGRSRTEREPAVRLARLKLAGAMAAVVNATPPTKGEASRP